MSSPECGMSANEMGYRFMHDMDFVLNEWKPRNKINIYKSVIKEQECKSGLYNPIKKQ